jgi:hypothetical protein
MQLAWWHVMCILYRKAYSPFYRLPIAVDVTHRIVRLAAVVEVSGLFDLERESLESILRSRNLRTKLNVQIKVNGNWQQLLVCFLLLGPPFFQLFFSFPWEWGVGEKIEFNQFLIN